MKLIRDILKFPGDMEPSQWNIRNQARALFITGCVFFVASIVNWYFYFNPVGTIGYIPKKMDWNVTFRIILFLFFVVMAFVNKSRIARLFWPVAAITSALKLLWDMYIVHFGLEGYDQFVGKFDTTIDAIALLSFSIIQFKLNQNLFDRFASTEKRVDAENN